MNHCHYSCYNILSFIQRCTTATIAGRASVFQEQKMMILVLAVMRTFGTQGTNEAGWNTVRLAAIVSQPLSQREGRVPGRLMPRCMPPWPDSCQRDPRAREESREESDGGRHFLGQLPCQSSEWCWWERMLVKYVVKTDPHWAETLEHPQWDFIFYTYEHMVSKCDHLWPNMPHCVKTFL